MSGITINGGIIVDNITIQHAEPISPMILTIDTTLEANLVMLIPLRGNTNVVIDWGDGSNTIEVNANLTVNLQKTYSANGNYTISITGTSQQYGFPPGDSPNTNQKITGVSSFGTLGLQSLIGAFRTAINLTSVPATLPSTVANLNQTFQGANNLNDSNINSWNTSNVTDMDAMFASASIFNSNIGSWDTSNVTNMNNMFNSAFAFNQNISSWDVSNVTNMDSTFRFCNVFNQNLSSWITGLTSQPLTFSAGANSVFANNASNLKPYLQDGVTRINT